MTCVSDERDEALAKLEKIREWCAWVQPYRLPAHRWVIKEILAVIDGVER